MPDIYVSPTGSGNNSGSDANNALSITSIDMAAALAGPGGRVLLLADQGDYNVSQTLAITHGGTEGAPVTITGVSSTGEPMEAHFVGSRNPVYTPWTPPGNLLFAVASGADHLVLQNMQIDNTGTAIQTVNDVSDITIRDITANNVQRFFQDSSAVYDSATQSSVPFPGNTTQTTATVNGLTIENVNVTGFSKGVVELRYDTHDVVINNVHGDVAGQTGDNFATGIHFDGTVHNVVVNASSIANAQNFRGTYWNGDAFGTESDVYNVVFQNTAATGSTDAGYDLKSSATTLINTYSADNSKNYKLWGDITLIDPVGVDPNSRGGSNGQIQIQTLTGAKVTVIGGVLMDSGTDTYAIALDGDISFTGTTVQIADVAHLTHKTGVPADQGATSLPGVSVSYADATGDHSTGTDYHDVTQPPLNTPAIPRNIVQVGDEATDSHTAAQDVFKVDTAAHTATTKLDGFDGDDLLVTTTRFADSNKDGIINAGGNHMFNEGDDGVIGLGKVTSIRYLGELDGGYAYGALSTRPAGAIEGTFANDVLKGDAANLKADSFFFDTHLNYSLGSDVIQRFGANDRIVTTSVLAPGSDGVVHAEDGTFALHDNGLGDHLTIIAADGHTVDALALTGYSVVNGVEYYSYTEVPLI